MPKYNATFTSIWDGNFAVYSRCYVSKRKRLVTRMGRNNISSDVGYVMRAFIKFFDLYKEDRANLSAIENIPCRLAVVDLNCIGIGHPTEDRFVPIGAFLKINE